MTKTQNPATAPAFAVGDRVRMISGCTNAYGAARVRVLRGVVVPWGARLIVQWEDWPCMTALPNPNVELDQ